MATRSLKQIKKEIQAWAQDHGQLYTAKFCNALELLDEGDVLYPALYFDFVRARKDVNVLYMDFTATVADRINPEKDNEADVWSDTILIGCDLLAFLDGADREYKLENSAPLVPFTERDGDNVAGVTIDFTLRVNYPYNRCDIPTKAVGQITTEASEPMITEASENITL